MLCPILPSWSIIKLLTYQFPPLLYHSLALTNRQISFCLKHLHGLSHAGLEMDNYLPRASPVYSCQTYPFFCYRHRDDLSSCLNFPILRAIIANTRNFHHASTGKFKLFFLVFGVLSFPHPNPFSKTASLLAQFCVVDASQKSLRWLKWTQMSGNSLYCINRNRRTLGREDDGKVWP